MAMASGGANLRDAVQRREEVVPDAALARERVPAGAGQLVVAPPALSLPLDPPAFDQAAILEAIERRIERGDVEVDGAVGALGNELADLVAVSAPLLEQREDQEFGAAALQF